MGRHFTHRGWAVLGPTVITRDWWLLFLQPRCRPGFCRSPVRTHQPPSQVARPGQKRLLLLLIATASPHVLFQALKQAADVHWSGQVLALQEPSGIIVGTADSWARCSTCGAKAGQASCAPMSSTGHLGQRAAIPLPAIVGVALQPLRDRVGALAAWKRCLSRRASLGFEISGASVSRRKS